MEGQNRHIISMLHNIINDYEVSNALGRGMQPVVPAGSSMDELASKVLHMCQQADGQRLLEQLDVPTYVNGQANVDTTAERSGSSQIRCQVDGCRMDLMTLKDYHQRYRICSEHLKCDYVIRDGQKMRFCQQCGKFQSLASFDHDKRSCRDRLRRHNERRRKRATPAGHMTTRGMDERVNFDQDLGTVADLLSYMGACRDMDEAHVAAIMEGKNPTSLRTDPDALSSAKVISMILNKNMDSISPRPLVPNIPTMQFLLQQFARMFHYQLGGVHLIPCENALMYYDKSEDDASKKVKTSSEYHEADFRNRTDENFEGHAV